MKPMVLEAEDKGADILIAMTDIFNTIKNIELQRSIICHNSKVIEMKEIKTWDDNELKLYFFKSKFHVSQKLRNLREIWVLDSKLDRVVVLSDVTFLLNHLNSIK